MIVICPSQMLEREDSSPGNRTLSRFKLRKAARPTEVVANQISETRWAIYRIKAASRSRGIQRGGVVLREVVVDVGSSPSTHR